MRYRLFRLARALVRFVCRATLRAVITGLIFTTCLLAGLAYMGVRPSDLQELPDVLESVSRLAGVLS